MEKSPIRTIQRLVNGTIDTNLGLFRAYMVMYLRRHPFVSKELLLMVRTLPPVANGLPGPDLLFLLEQKLAELRIHPGRNHGTLRFRIAGVRTLSVPKRRRPRYDPEQLHRIRQSRSIDTDRNPLAYDRHAKQPVRCRKTGGARLISESITDSGFHPLPTRQYRDKRTSGTGIGSPRLQQPDGPAPDRLGPNEKHPAGIGRVFLVTRRATSGKTAFSPPLLDTLLRLYGHGENLPAIKQTAPRRLLFRQTMLAPPSTTTC